MAKSSKSPDKKYGADLNALGNKKTPTAKLLTEVSVSGFSVYAIAGQLVEETKTGIHVRYKKDKGRAILREFFSFSHIVAFHRKGDKVVVWVKLNRALFIEQCGKPQALENGLIQLTTISGDTLYVNPNNSSNLETSIKSIEDEEFFVGGKSKSPKRETKPVFDDEEDEEEDDRPLVSSKQKDKLKKLNKK
jgi:hypothetical protein